MHRRAASSLLAALIAFAPLPARSQVGRVTFEAPVTPGLAPTAGAVNVSPLSPVLPSALTPALSPALTPALAAPHAVPVFTAPVAVAQAAPTATARITPAAIVPRRAVNQNQAEPSRVLSRTAELAAETPEQLGRLYDAAPAAPDFAALTTVRVPQAPAPWRPGSALLKPAAAAINAWRAARHEKRLSLLGPKERVTTEELRMRETLTTAHAALAAGRLQDALEELTPMFKGRDAESWYKANSGYQPYQRYGHGYIRFIEQAVKLAHERAHARSRETALIAEARAAASAGTLLGHEWRATRIQERDSAHCAHHALFNAIQASVGFAYPLSVHRFIERARETLNSRIEILTGKTGAQLAALENGVGLKFGVDVGEGMDTGALKKWGRLLGLNIEARAAPRGDAQWSALLGGGREVLLGLRMFHERYKHSPEESARYGHDYAILHHEVYLLGAFDSPSRRVRLYMVQDSGSGATDFYTAEELSAVAEEIQVVWTRSPVALP